MKNDPGSNFTIAEAYAAASVGASTVYTSAVDHRDRPSASFLITCGTFATSFVATTQYSDDNSTWTDEPDTTAGNDVSVTLTEADSAQLDVPNPRARYSRVKMVLGGTCVIGAASIAGPKLYTEPAATT